MGFMVGLLLTAMIAYGLYRYAVSSTARAKFHREFVQSPSRFVVAFIGVGLIMIFFWGIFIPPFGKIQIPIGAHRNIPLWQIGGIGAVIWMVVFWKFMWRR